MVRRPPKSALLPYPARVRSRNAERIMDARAGRKIDRGDGKGRGVRVGRRDRGAEGERARARATDIDGRSAVIKLQWMRASDFHALVEAERQCGGIAGVVDSCSR